VTDADIRALFPGVARRKYFNAASASLLPAPVREAVGASLDAHVEGGIHAWTGDREALARARVCAARLIGASADEIAFVQNTAEGISRVAGGIAWRRGDEVVVGDLEYPANVYPWAAQQERGARLTVVRSENGTLPAERLIDAMSPRTRVVAVSMVQFTSGYRVDLRALGRACAERGALLAVDAIQGLGVLPLDVRELGIGALAVEGRKWLMGPSGTGFLFVSRDWIERIRPTAVGAWSVRDPEDYLQWSRAIDGQRPLDLNARFAAGAARYEPGYPNMAGVAGLGAALELGEQIGRARIGAQVLGLATRLVNGLEGAGIAVYGPTRPEERSGIVTFEPAGDAQATLRALAERGFSLALRDGRLRASPHVYNSATEVDELLEALTSPIRHGR